MKGSINGKSRRREDQTKIFGEKTKTKILPASPSSRFRTPSRKLGPGVASARGARGELETGVYGLTGHERHFVLDPMPIDIGNSNSESAQDHARRSGRNDESRTHAL